MLFYSLEESVVVVRKNRWTNNLKPVCMGLGEPCSEWVRDNCSEWVRVTHALSG